MQITTTEQTKLERQIDATYIMNFLQVAYPDGFIKKYGRFLNSDLDRQQLVKSIKFMISDLTDDQLKSGMKRARHAGHCPDVGLFVAWCLGLNKFESVEDQVRNTYFDADAALAYIINFTKQQSEFMTNAMEKAYQDTMQMFHDLEFSDNSNFLVGQVYRSFKSCYSHHVSSLTSQGIRQVVIAESLKLGHTKEPVIDDRFKPYNPNKPNG